MSFVNPIQLLQLEHYEITAITAEVITAAKNSVLNEIADTGQTNYLGAPISGHDCQTALLELSASEKLTYYLEIAQNAPLSAFLHNGDPGFFLSFKWDGMYRNAIYLDIISPYFATQYSPLLLKAYLDEDYSLFKALMATEPLVLEKDVTVAYAALQENITTTLSTIRSIRVTVNDPEHGNDLSGLKGLFIKYLPVDKIKLFPPALDFLRGQIEREVHALSTNTANESLLQICIPFLARLKKGKPADDGVITWSESDMRELVRFQELQKEFHVLVLRIDNRSIDVKEVTDWVQKNIDITVYNELPSTFNILHNPLALELDALAVALYIRTGNPAAGMDYLLMAEKLGYLTNTTLEKLATTKADLQEYIDDPEKERLEDTEEKERKPLSTWQIVLICIFVARLLLLLYRLANPPYHRDLSSAVTFQENPWHDKSNFKPSDIQSISANQPLTGASPLDKYLGKGEYTGTASLMLVNNRSLDILVCLYDKQTKKLVRNVYVREQSNFTVDQLKPGNYTADVYMGKDWDDAAKNELGGTGAFTSSLVHKRIKNPVHVKANQEAPVLEINNPK
ncbi:MAG: hypothetical protein J7623_22000 [Chitinophaga sp.]|uniref:hypothetical protein n=1 Tax=Chitinophaga sp. TaxID=1869181 RepID=UPI001B2CF41F|nr:hypothetical protein [Chitinophaga sp.]MBO9731328.1 hypothetical protein [Chitinophaga sp.]